MTKLAIELDQEPKIKVVALIKYYNFALGYTAMQTFYDIVQTRSNIPISMMTYTITMTQRPN